MRFYFIGVCGTAMGNAALLLRALGHEVFGSDQGVYPPMSDLLMNSDVTVFIGYDERRLEQLKPDVVVVGNAISRGNAEVEWVLDSGKVPFTSLPQLFHDHILPKRLPIVVTGTHGKTTTTTLAAWLLREHGREPGYLIGGVPHDLPDGQAVGVEGGPFVIEGDEYDSAFFDKRSKFIHYRPRILLLNNLEFDHADIFRDLDDVKRTFQHVLRIVPRSGFVVVNGDDANIASLLPVRWTKVVRVGEAPDNDLVIRDFADDPSGSTFSLVWRGEPWGTVTWSLSGRFNARNGAMAALAAGLAIDPLAPHRAIRLETMARFQGVRRRQEVLHRGDTVVVIEDFGHHPTAIASTLHSLRSRFPGARLAACFEPRSNTARTKVLQDEFQVAFSLADVALLGPVHRADLLPVNNRFDAEGVCAALRSEGRYARAFANNQALLDDIVHFARQQRASDPLLVVVFFSNGAFDGIIPQCVTRVKAK